MARINANRCAMWDNGATKEKRPGRCVNTVIPGLTPYEEGLLMKATLRPLAPAPRPAVSAVSA